MDKMEVAIARFRHANRNKLNLPFSMACKQQGVDPVEASARLRYREAGPKVKYRAGKPVL